MSLGITITALGPLLLLLSNILNKDVALWGAALECFVISCSRKGRYGEFD